MTIENALGMGVKDISQPLDHISCAHFPHPTHCSQLSSSPNSLKMPKCPTCLNLRTITDKEVPFYDDVVLSAKSGCPSCSLIVKVVDAVISRYHAPKPSMVRWKKSENKLDISIIDGENAELYKDIDVHLQFKGRLSFPCYYKAMSINSHLTDSA